MGRMSAGRLFPLKNNIRKKNGFTLLEVVASVAVLSIVSVALLQMFTLSIRTNRNAFNMDKANALCIETGELFKADPTSGASYLTNFSSSPLLPLPVGITTYTECLDNDWNYVGKWALPLPAGSAYKVDIEINVFSPAAVPVSYYPEDVCTMTLPGSINLYMEKAGASGCTVSLGGTGATMDLSNIIFSGSTPTRSGTAVVPIYLKFDEHTAFPVTIDVRNTVGTLKYIDTGLGIDEDVEAIADIYLCDVPAGESVTINAVEGISTENRISTATKEAVKYSARIWVTRLSDNSVMAENTVEKYWVKD